VRSRIISYKLSLKDKVIQAAAEMQKNV
jgi:hypothetical protein